MVEYFKVESLLNFVTRLHSWSIATKDGYILISANANRQGHKSLIDTNRQGFQMFHQIFLNSKPHPLFSLSCLSPISPEKGVSTINLLQFAKISQTTFQENGYIVFLFFRMRTIKAVLKCLTLLLFWCSFGCPVICTKQWAKVSKQFFGHLFLTCPLEEDHPKKGSFVMKGGYGLHNCLKTLCKIIIYILTTIYKVQSGEPPVTSFTCSSHYSL